MALNHKNHKSISRLAAVVKSKLDLMFNSNVIKHFISTIFF